MEPAIKTFLAALFTACAIASWVYSPKLLLALVMGGDWRLEMYGPQIDRVPALLHTPVVLVFLVLAAWMVVDVCAAFPSWKRVALGACGVAAVAVAGHWLAHTQVW